MAYKGLTYDRYYKVLLLHLMGALEKRFTVTKKLLSQ